MSFGCWTILYTHRELLSIKNPTALQFLTHSGVHGTYYHTPFRGTDMYCLGHSTSEWHTYTIYVSAVSRLKNPSYLLVSSPSSTLIEVDLTITWSVSVIERAGVPNVLYTQYRLECCICLNGVARLLTDAIMGQIQHCDLYTSIGDNGTE